MFGLRLLYLVSDIRLLSEEVDVCFMFIIIINWLQMMLWFQLVMCRDWLSSVVDVGNQI